MTTIRYFIPDDGDTEDTPNVFLAPKSSSSSSSSSTQLGTIKSSFPLPGKYHFRFKTSLGGSSSHDLTGGGGLAVWMDCIDNSKPVPTYQTSIIAKVTRISVGNDDDNDCFYDEDEDDEYVTDDSDKEFEELRQNGVNNSAAAATAAATAAAASNHYRNPSTSSSNPAASSPRASPTPQQSDDLFNVFHDNTNASITHSNPPSSHPSSTDLFEEETTLDDFLSGSTITSNNANHNVVDSTAGDLLGMTATTTPAATNATVLPQRQTQQHSHLSASMPVLPSHPHPHAQQQQQYPYPAQNGQHQQQQQQYPYNSQNNGPFGNLNWK